MRISHQLPAALKSFRIERQWSQAKLSERSGVVRSQIGHYETGVVSDPSWSTVEKILNAMDLTLFHLVFKMAALEGIEPPQDLVPKPIEEDFEIFVAAKVGGAPASANESVMRAVEALQRLFPVGPGRPAVAQPEAESDTGVEEG